jgi:hypothetical protein
VIEASSVPQIKASGAISDAVGDEVTTRQPQALASTIGSP